MKKTNLLQIRIDEELLNSLTELAKSNGLSISSQVRMLVKKGVDNG
jgi:antitoxin component of RelBE/YafQ-DinJ toxin-antitoxin module